MRAYGGALAVVLIVASSLMAPGAAARRGCRAQCRQECRSDCQTPDVTCDSTDAQDCIDALRDDLRDCRDIVNGAVFELCLDNRCKDGTPGRCTLTRECVDACRANRQSQLAVCDRRFSAQARGCGAGTRACLVAERTARKACFRECRQPDLVCIDACQGEQTPPPVIACQCQANCVNAIVASCYANCIDQCDGDTTALKVCKQTCRDQKCDRLMKACTGDGTDTSSYDLCCSQCNNNCEDDLAAPFACEQLVTTTTTSSTTTTTTTTSSTTTTFR